MKHLDLRRYYGHELRGKRIRVVRLGILELHRLNQGNDEGESFVLLPHYLQIWFKHFVEPLLSLIRWWTSLKISERIAIVGLAIAGVRLLL